MIKSIITSFLLQFILLFSVSGQSIDYFSKVKIISNSLEIKSDDITIPLVIKEYKKIVNQIDRDSLLVKAVVSSKIGAELSKKQYYKEADYFFNVSFKYRKKIGSYIPIRWALSALYNNSIKAKDYQLAVKYSIIWLDQVMENINDSSWHSIYKNQLKYYSLEEIIVKEHYKKINTIGNTSNSTWNNDKISSVDAEERYLIGEKMLISFMKKYGDRNDRLVPAVDYPPYGYYQHIIYNYWNKNNIDKVKFWEKRALKTLKKNTNKTAYSNCIRAFAALYKNNPLEMDSLLNQTEALRMINEYMEVCKKINRHDQVGFGLRYSGLRYMDLEEYVKGIHHFTDAIKYCHLHDLKGDISKSYTGVHKLLNKIAKNKDLEALELCKHWTVGYD
ncbi:hypothetical protein [Flammeovirga sp. EKP202]|uniref:hypothetical protein n=1 Tax=Flammeovirga sp. EKP202 TaxID=2770592 RepID=UPI00165F803B|nr:hypothetical protein [Flammeovirga sp. EKP202]MBD0405448.1 hypothetical protein [Flammeovirga sp. EKP202]